MSHLDLMCPICRKENTLSGITYLHSKKTWRRTSPLGSTTRYHLCQPADADVATPGSKLLSCMILNMIMGTYMYIYRNLSEYNRMPNVWFQYQCFNVCFWYHGTDCPSYADLTHICVNVLFMSTDWCDAIYASNIFRVKFPVCKIVLILSLLQMVLCEWSAKINSNYSHVIHQYSRRPIPCRSANTWGPYK